MGYKVHSNFWRCIVTTAQGLQELYSAGKYRELLEAAITASDVDDQDKANLLIGWSFHQLGDYAMALAFMSGLVTQYPADSEIGDSARRGLAHALYQIGEHEEGTRILEELQPSLNRVNVRANAILQDSRAKRPIPMAEIQHMIIEAMWTVPHRTVNGHIINNLTTALHEVREQQEAQPLLAMLPGLMEIALGIYEETGAAQNHVAGVLYRASLVFEAAGWQEGAKTVIRQSVKHWQELVVREGGERYQNNLNGAQEVAQRLNA